MLLGHCHGLQVCQVPVADLNIGEPCPVLGSYLSIEYHCKHGQIGPFLNLLDFHIVNFKSADGEEGTI